VRYRLVHLWLALNTVCLAMCCVVLALRSEAQTLQTFEDPPATHNMMIVGNDKVFLSHLPMFDKENKDHSAFLSPHRYQVILEATLSRAGQDVTQIYIADRARNPGVKMYTLNPEEFVLARLFMPDLDHPTLRSFRATVFRGHLERGGVPVQGLEGVQVEITRAIYARLLEPGEKKPERLQYVLFGKGHDMFLAHTIFEPPDFDQLISVTLDHDLPSDQMARGVQIVIADRANVATNRLKQNQQVTARVADTTASATAPSLQIHAGTEFYFEEGELLVPPTFDPTPEEKASGF
jgi:hypothetical protein